jgi:hypothetical protein
VAAVRIAAALAALAALALPALAAASGGHDAVGCAGCHSAHAPKGAVISALPPNTKLLDPHSGAPASPLSAMCLSCHADAADGGQGIAPVSEHLRHPFSVAKPNPKLAVVPPELLRDGRFECVSCHDPHPSNPNYRYLRIAVKGAPSMGEFCGMCHPRKAAPTTGTKLFSSMDERAERTPP